MLNYRGWVLKGFDFQGKTIENTCFWGCDARGVSFGSASIAGADCRAGNFSYASFYKTNCEGVNFSGANLYKADFRGADLSGVTFSTPSIITCYFSHQTNFSNAIYCHLGEEDFLLLEVLKEISVMKADILNFENPLLQSA